MKYYINYSNKKGGMRESGLFDGIIHLELHGSDGEGYRILFIHTDIMLRIRNIVGQEVYSVEAIVGYNYPQVNRMVFSELPGGAAGYFYTYEGTTNIIPRITRNNLRQLLEDMSSNFIQTSSLNLIADYIRKTFGIRVINSGSELRFTFANTIEITISIIENFYRIQANTPIFSNREVTTQGRTRNASTFVQRLEEINTIMLAISNLNQRNIPRVRNVEELAGPAPLSPEHSVAGPIEREPRIQPHEITRGSHTDAWTGPIEREPRIQPHEITRGSHTDAWTGPIPREPRHRPQEDTRNFFSDIDEEFGIVGSPVRRFPPGNILSPIDTRDIPPGLEPPVLRRQVAVDERQQVNGSQQEETKLSEPTPINEVFNKTNKSILEHEIFNSLRDTPAFADFTEHLSYQLENLVLTTGGECSVCYTNIPNTIIEPCRHRVCSTCFNRERRRTGLCPICRKKIENSFNHFGGNLN